MCVNFSLGDEASTLQSLRLLTEEVELYHWLYYEVREAVGELIQVSKPAFLPLCLCVVAFKGFHSYPGIPQDWPLI